MRGEYQLKKMKQKDLDKDKKTAFSEISPSNMKFTKEELAKYLICWDFKEPHVSNRGAQKNFIHFMRYVNGRKFKPIYDKEFFKNSIAKAILFKKTAAIIKGQKNIEGYRSQVLNFTISLMSNYSKGNLNFNLIWQDQAYSLSDSLLDLIDDFALKTYKIILKASSGNISEWCKSEESFEHLLNSDLKFDKDILEFEKTNNISKKYLSQKSIQNIKVCKNLSIADWKDLWEWSKDTDKVDIHLCNLALSLYGMAEKKWINDPSENQAEQIMVSIKIAEDDGII